MAAIINLIKLNRKLINNKIIKLEERIKYLEERVELNKIVVKNLPCALMELFIYVTEEMQLATKKSSHLKKW